MFPFLSKFSFLRKKPKIIMVSGKNASLTEALILPSLREFFKVTLLESSIFSRNEILKNEILISCLPENFRARKFNFWVKHSFLPIFVVTNLSDIPAEDIAFASKKDECVIKLAKLMPPFSYLILNYDDETVREIGDNLNVRHLTFGFGENADFRATNYHIDENGINFKLNFKGNVLPVWLRYLFGKKYVYAALATLAVGTVLDLNLIELSQNLKDRKGISGKGRVLRGFKNSLILDNSKISSISSVREGLNILNEIGLQKKEREFWQGKKIAVLGDVLGVGKYTIEAHETLGESVAKVADMLLAVGERAKFIAEEAKIKGMGNGAVFQFYDTSKAASFLKAKINRGDIILVAGSAEMKMEEIVEALEDVSSSPTSEK
ncbi:hypothetical protein J7J81_03465 [bacterium]|nr:hypothetical protein [bacterium]